MQGSQPGLRIEGWRGFSLQCHKNQLLRLLVLEETDHVWTHVVTRKKESLSPRILKECEDVIGGMGLEAKAVRTARVP